MGPKKPPPTLASCMKQPITFMADSADVYNSLITSCTLKAEIQKAHEHVAALTDLVPAGTTVAMREIADVTELLVANPEGVLFSGTLTSLCLPERAASAIDSGRIGYIIDAATTPAQLKNLMGSIIVNTDGADSGFKRANKDAEVDALCLMMYWHKHLEDHTKALKLIASDLVFHGRRLGAGSKTFAARFELMNAEEESRKHTGRQCMAEMHLLERICNWRCGRRQVCGGESYR